MTDQPALFDLPDRITEGEAEYPPRLWSMHNTYGSAEIGEECGDCAKFMTRRPGRRIVHKCELYGCSFSAVTDWRVHWPACGRFRLSRGVDGELYRASEKEGER